MIKLGAHEDWTKSSYSVDAATCVEVRSTVATAIGVTDSKIPDTPARPTLAVSPGAFTAFVQSVRT